MALRTIIHLIARKESRDLPRAKSIVPAGGLEDGGERKVTVRFTQAEFDQLDEKRFRQRTTFQAIGRQLFLDWVAGENTGKEDTNRISSETGEFLVETYVTPVLRPWHNLLDLILRRAPEHVQRAIKSNLEAFAELTFVGGDQAKNDAEELVSEHQSIRERVDETIRRIRQSGLITAGNRGRNRSKERSSA